ncbi:hypothetical protein B9Z55_003839 [Caenorhabditis nigoni]|uniref:Sdz-33 F-box domain-containing protein n=1 Tax=Caenorhabditis nigoni TaxID=1611254 RepID=A0A2G5VSM9_9PELO|nr:hypothetical protein B9Z55_003839 [Caenorhabditis nigoni]
MEPHEILLLSFCSKRIQKSIKQQYRLRPNKGFRITCGINDPGVPHGQDEDEKRLELIIDRKWNDKKVINWKYVDSLDNLDLLKEFKSLKELYDNKTFDIELKSGSIFGMNGLGCKYSISFDPKFGIPTLYFKKDMMKKWPMELHKYCVDLFRTTPDLEMMLNLNDSSDLHESQTVHDLYLHDRYKSGHENCRILPRGWVHARKLIRFNGKNALIDSYGTTTAQDMNAFLKHWLNSDNTTLETMIIRGYCESTEKLFDGIKTRKWDPEKRPARYVSNAPLRRIVTRLPGRAIAFSNDSLFAFDHLDCTNALDIARESDELIVDESAWLSTDSSTLRCSEDL